MPSSRWFGELAAAVVLLIAAAGAAAETRTCLVVGISDGDTLKARCGDAGAFKQVKIRIAAIDAPESAQPYGQRSKQALSGLCYLRQAQITQRDTDRYGRVVADVSCAGQDVGVRQVVSGMAWVYARYAKDHPHLFGLEGMARTQRAGLWRDAAAVPPWEWRKQSAHHAAE